MSMACLRFPQWCPLTRDGNSVAKRVNESLEMKRKMLFTSKPRIRAILCLAPIFLASAWAQSDIVGLTLTDAVTLALKQNPDVQVANLTLASKQQDRVIARSEL